MIKTIQEKISTNDEKFIEHGYYNSFLNYISQYGTVIPPEIERIKEYFRYKKVKKKEVLISIDEPCNKMFFVISGMLRTYYRTTNNQCITRIIAIKDSFISNMNSFRGLCKNTETIECLENAEILVVYRRDFSQLMDEFSNLKEIYTEILEVYDAINIKRFHLMSLESVSAKIKFYKDCEYPFLIDKLSDSILASFLGVSRESIVRHKKIHTN